MFGDENQCEPVESGSRINYNLSMSKSVKIMCPETIVLKYIDGCSRYDKKNKTKPGNYYKNIHSFFLE